MPIFGRPGRSISHSSLTYYVKEGFGLVIFFLSLIVFFWGGVLVLAGWF